MAIRYQYGAEEVSALAQQAGRAQAAKQKLEMQFQKDMAMMDYQFRLQAEARARAWDIEKMEIASRNDFARMEKQRTMKQEEIDLKLKRINESDLLDENQKAEARLLAFGVEGFTSQFDKDRFAAEQKYREETLALQRERIEASKDPYDELAKRQIEEAEKRKKAGTAGVPSGQVEAVEPGAEVQPVKQLGAAAMQKAIPLEEVAPVELTVDSNGEFLVIAPDGTPGSIPPAELPTLFGQGYKVMPRPKGYWNAFFPQFGKPQIDIQREAMMQFPGFGGTGYNVPPKESQPYDSAERVRKGLRSVASFGR